MAIAFVQITAATSTNSGTSLTRAVTPTAGNLLVGCCTGNSSFTSFSDGVNSWNTDRSQGAGTERAHIGSAPNVAGGAVTVTATFASGIASFAVAEYSGVATSSHVGNVTGATGFGTSITTSAIAVDSGNLLVEVSTRTVGGGVFTFTEGANFDERLDPGSGTRPVHVQDRIVPSTTNYSGAVTINGGNSGWATALVTYVAAAAATGSGPLIDGRLTRSNLINGGRLVSC